MIQETFMSNGDADSLITRNNDEQLLDMAWEWLCSARENAPPSADIWDLCLYWPQQRDGLLTQLKAGRYRLSAMLVVGKKKQAMRTARDALVLKWVALKLAGRLPLHPRCEHVKGHGGGAASLRRLNEVVRSGDYPWVCRTDIKGYYGAIQKPLLLEQLRQQRLAPEVLHLLEQYLHYSVESGGEFHTPERGIPRGCALSPLMGALHLWAVDNHFARQPGIYYARYMDDFVILTKTRWQLRRQVASLNGFFNDYGFRQHPDKTFIGRTAKGFDWMGAQLGASGVTGVAPRALANHCAKVRRLYEQTWLSRTTRQAKVSVYRARWMKWALVAVGLQWGDVCAVELAGGLSPVLGTIRANPSGGVTPPFRYQRIHFTPTVGYIGLGRDAGGWAGDGFRCGTSTRPVSTVDGYRGITLSPGSVLIVSGKISSNMGYVSHYNAGPDRRFGAVGSLEISEQGDVKPGSFGTTNQGPGYLCAGVENQPAMWWVGNSDYRDDSTRKVDLSYRVYVKPGSPRFRVSDTLTYNSIAEGSLVQVPIDVSYDPASCALSVPAVIAFGDVGGGNVSTQGNIGVTCKGDRQLSVMIQATAPSPAPSGLGTYMTNDISGARVGVVSLYKGLTGSHNCTNSPSLVSVAGKPVVLDGAFPASSVGVTRDYPVTWALCPDRAAVPGAASGKMSLEVTW